MKKFREFVAEAAEQGGAADHHAALSLLSKHHGAKTNTVGPMPEHHHAFHTDASHEEVHKTLTSHGFKHVETRSMQGHPDHITHTYTKGKTTVHHTPPKSGSSDGGGVVITKKSASEKAHEREAKKSGLHGHGSDLNHAQTKHIESHKADEVIKLHDHGNGGPTHAHVYHHKGHTLIQTSGEHSNDSGFKFKGTHSGEKLKAHLDKIHQG